MQTKPFSDMRPSERIAVVTSFGRDLDKYAKMAEKHSGVEHTVLPIGAQKVGIFVPPRGSKSLSLVLREILTGNGPKIEPVLDVSFSKDKIEMKYHPAYGPLVELIRKEHSAKWKEKLGLDLETSVTETKR